MGRLLTHRRVTALAAVVALASCDGGPRRLGVESSEEVLLTLLDEPARMTVRSVERGDPFQVIASPSGDRRSVERGSRPSLVVPGRAELVFDLPKLPAAASLVVDAGIRVQHYEHEGRALVTLRAVHDGAEASSAEARIELPSSADTPPGERRWRRGALALRGADEVVVEVAYDGTSRRSPNVLLSTLEVRMPAQRVRRAASARHPSAVLVVVDTLRADVLGAYGDMRGLTPRLDALAEAGTVFERAYAASPWTAPSTATLLTALPPPEHGVAYDSVHDPRGAIAALAGTFTTLAEACAREGLRTAGFSANPLATGQYRMDQGFEHFVPYPWSQAKEGPVDDALAWLEGCAGQRFFLYLHLVDPHGPYVPDQEVAARFEAPEPAEAERLHTDRLVGDYFRGHIEQAALDEAIGYARVKYAGEVASLDVQMGRFLDGLAALGLAESTLVCLTSDHGEELGDNGLLGHVNQLFDATLSVPLFFSGPGVPAARVAAPVENRLVAGTLLELLGLPRAAPFDEAPLLGASAAESPLFFATRNGRMRHPRSGRWTPYDQQFGALDGNWLLHWAPAGPKYEREVVALFDVARDPAGEHDLAREEPEVVARLREGLEAWIARGVARRPDGLGGGGGAETLDELRALGYLGDDGEDASGAERPKR